MGEEKVKRTLSRLTTKLVAPATRMPGSSIFLGMLALTILVLGCLTMPGSPHRRLPTGDDGGATASENRPLHKGLLKTLADTVLSWWSGERLNEPPYHRSIHLPRIASGAGLDPPLREQEALEVPSTAV